MLDRAGRFAGLGSSSNSSGSESTKEETPSSASSDLLEVDRNLNLPFKLQLCIVWSRIGNGC